MFCLEQRSRVGLPCHERNQKKRGCCRTFREIAPVHTGLERGGRETQEPEAVLISYSDFLVTRSAIFLPGLMLKTWVEATAQTTMQGDGSRVGV